MRTPRIGPVLVLMLLVRAVLLGAVPAGAHSDVVEPEVPAGTEATVTIEVEHGCFDEAEATGLDAARLAAAATIVVEVAVPDGAVLLAAEPVAGWLERTVPGSPSVARWEGGTLAADTPGEFELRIIAPDTPGERLVLPLVQECADGSELAWVDPDPEAPLPAPAVAIVERAAGVAPATAPTTTTAQTATSPTTTAPPTTAPPTTAPTTTTSTSAGGDVGDGDDSALTATPAVLVAVGLLLAASVVVVMRRRR